MNNLFPVQNLFVTSLPSSGAFAYRGAIDCSTNPNYPAANSGDVYLISVAGKIGGASGTPVQAGDSIYCRLDGSPAGTQAAVGANWSILEANIPYNSALSGISIGVDGLGFPMTLGVKTPYVGVRMDQTITSWQLLLSASDTCTFDILYNATMGSAPVSICGSALPNCASAAYATSSTLTGWTPAVARGGIITVQCTVAPTTATWATLFLNTSRY